MSQSTHHHDSESNRTTEQRVGHPSGEYARLDERYTLTDEIVGASGADVVDPWVRMQYPIVDDGEDGVIRTARNYFAHQHPDGSGVIQSKAGTAIYAVRTPSGTILGNESRGLMWPWGCETDREANYYEFPFEFVDDLLAEQTDRDVAGDDWMRGVEEADILDDDHEGTGVLLTHEDGSQVYVGRDATSHERFDLFGFVTHDGDDGVLAPSAADALGLLKPGTAAAAEAGGAGVCRQGEWFLVPLDDEYPRSGPCKPGVGSRPYGGSPLESHVPREYALGVTCGSFLERVHEEFEELPEKIRRVQAFFDWLHETDAEPELYERARDLAGGIYVRGTIRHRGNEHYVENVGDDWHRAETHDWDVLTTDGTRYLAD